LYLGKLIEFKSFGSNINQFIRQCIKEVDSSIGAAIAYSSDALKAEIANINKQIKIKKSKKEKRDWGNAAWFIGGFLLIVPWFFMDLKNAEETEIDALQQRKDALIVIAAEKECGF